MKVLTPQAMRAVDREAIEEFGIPSLVLMENAAIGVVDALAERFPEARSVTVMCGPGNNGGDGMAAARHLAIRGYLVQLFLVGGREPAGDAGVQLTICRNQGLEIHRVSEEGGERQLIEAARDSDLVIDALFGTGLSRPLEGPVAQLVEEVNRLPVARLAVDLPSGLSGGSAKVPGPHLEADLTVTFAAPKLAHVLPPAAEAVGEVVVADLGIPPELVERAPGGLHLLQPEELAPLLVPRPVDGHKGDFGHVLLCAGGTGKAGAAILAARGAVRAGAGLVTVAVPAPILAAVDGGSLESMTLPLEMSEGGLAPAAADQLLEAAVGKDVLALGPGLGLEKSTVEAVRRVCREAALPLVIDADGINAFAGEPEALAGRSSPTALTPHPGELARLLGVSTDSVVDDRLGMARRAAAATQALIVLKGHLSLVADDEGGAWVNPTGNPGMATGGSGDVLTGILAGLVAQGYELSTAAQLGVFLHGLAGDLASESTGMTALAAGDLLRHLGTAFDRLSRA
jgi:NAD(P)H-hydrate epimerase